MTTPNATTCTRFRIGIEIETCAQIQLLQLRLFTRERDLTIRCDHGQVAVEFILDNARGFYAEVGSAKLFEKRSGDRFHCDARDALVDVTRDLQEDIASMFASCRACAARCAVHVHISDPRASSINDPALHHLTTFQLVRLWTLCYQDHFVKHYAHTARSFAPVEEQYARASASKTTPTEQIALIHKWRPGWDRTQTLNIRGPSALDRWNMFDPNEGARVEIRTHDDLLRTYRDHRNAVRGILNLVQDASRMFSLAVAMAAGKLPATRSSKNSIDRASQKSRQHNHKNPS